MSELITSFIKLQEKLDFDQDTTGCPLGTYIRNKRNEKDYSLRKLGEITGLSYSHLSKIERGDHIPEKSTLETIAKALDVDIEELYILGGYVPFGVGIEAARGIGASEIRAIKERLFSNSSNEKLLRTAYDIYRKLLLDENLETILSKHYKDLFAIPEDRKNEFFKILSKENYDELESKDKENLVEIFDLRNSLVHSEIAATRMTTNFDSVIITNALSRSKSRMDDIIQKSGRTNRVNINENESEFIKIPIYGEIKAGYDFLGEQNVIGYEITSKSSISDGEYFYLKVKGDSMIDDGIIDGCKVLVRRQGHVENGKIGVVIVNGEEATLKRVFYDGDKVILQASNKNIPPRNFSLHEILIQGQVRSYVVDL